MVQKQSDTIDYPVTNKLPLLLFCGFIIFFYLQGGYRFSTLGTIRFELIYALVLAFFSLSAPKGQGKNCPISSWIWLYFFVLIIQLPFSYDFETSWEVFVDRILKFAFVGGFIVVFIRSPRDLKYFLSAFLLACFKMGQEGFLGQITGSLVWQNQGVMRLHGTTPIYEHPNSFSGMALGTLPFLYTLWPLYGKKIKFFLCIMAVFAINIIVFSGSRTAYVGFIVLFLVIFSKEKNKSNFVIYGTILLFCSLPFIPDQYVERFESIFTQKDKEGHSTDTRKVIIQDAIEIFIDHPFGVGIRAFPAIRKDVFGRHQDTHNLYLEVATNLGIQGLIVFLVLIFKMLKMLNTLRDNFSGQRHKILDYINGKSPPEHRVAALEKHLQDLRLLEAVSLAVYLFIWMRIALGLFGMDLYEIYWWFAGGMAISLWNMETTACLKTKALLA